MTRVIFLGTASGTSAITKQLRSSGGFIIQSNGLQLHVNPGPGALNTAKTHGINPNHTTAVLASDNNIHHTNDINVVIEAMTHGGLDKQGVCLASKSVFDSEKRCLTMHHNNLLEKSIALEQNHKVGIADIEIHALPVDQEDETAIGFKFMLPRGTLSYPGNTAITPELVAALQGTDVLVLNVPFVEQTKEKRLNIKQASELINAIQPKIVVLTGFSSEMIKHDPLEASREIQRITGVQTIAAKDGLVLSTSSTSGSPVKGY